MFAFQVFVECSGTEEESTPFSQSRLYKLLDRYENTIRIQVSLPPFDPSMEPLFYIALHLLLLSILWLMQHIYLERQSWHYNKYICESYGWLPIKYLKIGNNCSCHFYIYHRALRLMPYINMYNRFT